MNMRASTDYWVVLATVAPIMLLAATTSTREMAKRKNVGKAWAAWVGIGFAGVVAANIGIEAWALLRLAGGTAWDSAWWVPGLAVALSFVVIGIWGTAPYFNMYRIFGQRRKGTVKPETPDKYDVRISFPDPRSDIHIEVTSLDPGNPQEHEPSD
jgi:hypothetical protein